MKYLSDITESHINIIAQAMHDVLPEYKSDAILTQKVAKIIKSLSENHSMYQFTSEDLDIICMGLNDCCYVLDDILKDLEKCDIPEGREYRSEIERITELLSKL